VDFHRWLRGPRRRGGETGDAVVAHVDSKKGPFVAFLEEGPGWCSCFSLDIVRKGSCAELVWAAIGPSFLPPSQFHPVPRRTADWRWVLDLGEAGFERGSLHEAGTESGVRCWAKQNPSTGIEVFRFLF